MFVFELKQDIKGIICLHQAKSDLIESVKKQDNIELFEYNFGFNKIE